MWKKINVSIILAVLLCSLAFGTTWAGSIVCGASLAPCASTPVQSKTILNTQTTGAATTAVPVTLAAAIGTRNYLYSVEARCNTEAATSSLTVTDGGVTIWSTQAALVTTVTNYQRVWAPALSGATNSAMVITWAACTAGTGTLIVQADRW